MSQQTKTARAIARYCIGGAIALATVGLIAGNVQLTTIGVVLVVINGVLLTVYK